MIKNTEVDNINNTLMEQIAGDLDSLYNVDSVVEKDNPALYTPEFPNSLNLSGLPPHRINIKTGAPIMLFRNLNISRRQCNGARYNVKVAARKLLMTKLYTSHEKHSDLQYSLKKMTISSTISIGDETKTNFQKER